MKFDIPKKCYIRWQAALAVLEDLQEDIEVPFNMRDWADHKTKWKHSCGTAACFAGYISIAPYCQEIGYPGFDRGFYAQDWLLNKRKNSHAGNKLHNQMFAANINEGSRNKTLSFLEALLKSIFKESTGKTLKAPLTFYVD